MSEPLKLVVTPDADLAFAKERMTELLMQTITQVQSGEVTGLLLMLEGKKGFAYSRINIYVQIALGFLSRVAYRINQDYDNPR